MKLFALTIYLMTALIATRLCSAGEEAKYYFDAGWRGEVAIKAALERIETMSKAHPDAQIEILIHGSDIRLFAQSLSRQNPQILKHSTLLAANDNIKFKVCDHALVYKNLLLKNFPEYFNTVYYVPEYIRTLEENGYRPISLSRGGVD